MNELSKQEDRQEHTTITASKRNTCKAIFVDLNINSTEREDERLIIELYDKVHSHDLILFLLNSWKEWVELGKDRDKSCYGNSSIINGIPPLIPQNFPLRTNKNNFKQKPSANVMGKIGFYCTDLCTPIVGSLQQELIQDAFIVKKSCSLILQHYQQQEENDTIVYALTTHPGHHASTISFGGYCYLNHAAAAATNILDILKEINDINNNQKNKKVAIIDVDYHVGNGTLEIFSDDDNVIVISLHCDPNIEYPFHAGFADDNGENSNFNIPLPPGTNWKDYKIQLLRALEYINEQAFHDELVALIISLGLDTLNNDPVAVSGAGFQFLVDDYLEMGTLFGQYKDPNGRHVPILLVQEGGYVMDSVGILVRNVLNGIGRGRNM